MPRRNGGLRLSSLVQPLPATDGPDVSWMQRIRPGDDQGSEGACALFAIANWLEIMRGVDTSDEDCLSLYRETCRSLSRPPGAGLTFVEAFTAAQNAGWLALSSDISECERIDQLREQPLLGAFIVDGALDNVSPSGCLDHGDDYGRVRGYHAMCIVASGNVTAVPGGPWVYVENSWGRSWGADGVGVMSYALYSRICRELWRIVE